MTPLVSIIIPSYNRADLIAETLDSVLKQTYSNWECIIVDDGSTDNSLAVIQKYLNKDSRFLFLSRPNYKKKGPSSCRNYGIEKAKGDYIIFLDSDDLLVTTCLDNRIEFAKQNLEYDFWIFKMQTFGFNEVSVFDYGVGFCENEYYKNEFSQGNHPFVITCPLWKKKVLIEINGFNENLFINEDPELHLRILKNNYRLKFANFELPDCFYRLKEDAKIDEINKLINNYIFFENHLNINDSYSIIYYKKTINHIVFKRVLVSWYLKFCILGLKRGILSKCSFFYGLILLLYHFIKLNKLTGIGYNYFKTQFNNF